MNKSSSERGVSRPASKCVGIGPSSNKISSLFTPSVQAVKEAEKYGKNVGTHLSHNYQHSYQGYLALYPKSVLSKS